VTSASSVQVGTDANWLTVDAGYDFTIALRDDGTLWTWGWNEAGLLGLGTSTDVNQPTQIDTNTNWKSVDAGNIHVAAIRTDGTLWTWGRFRGKPTRVGSGSNWQAVSASGQSVEIPYGDTHTIALRDDGTLWAWGSNERGQLGIGTFTTQWPYIVNEPTQVGSDTNWRTASAGWLHTMALRNDGTLWAWGLNGAAGALGIGSTIDATNVPVQVGTNNNWAAVSALRLYTRAVRTDGTLWVWGLGSGTGLSTNAYEPVQVGTDANWRSVPTDDNHFYQEGTNPPWPWRSTASGIHHSVAVRHDGTLWASGRNDVGQLAQPVHWLPYPVPGRNWGVRD
jgi:alpha-tubulin suppressor-like RCC1 family protein